MEIFGIGAMELMVLLVLALIIVGPQKLPEVARNVGRTVGEFKTQTDQFKKVMTFEPASPAADRIPGMQPGSLPDERLVALEHYYNRSAPGADADVAVGPAPETETGSSPESGDREPIDLNLARSA